MKKHERWLVDKDGFVLVQVFQGMTEVALIPMSVEHKGKVYDFVDMYQDVQLFSEREEEGQA